MAGGVFAQYSLLVKDTARISDRRQTVNTLYLSANSIILGGVVLLVQQADLRTAFLLFPVVVVAVAGFVLCLDWRRLIINYRKLLELRFSILEKLEEQLGVSDPGMIKMFQIEQRELYSNPKKGRGISVFGFSDIERNIPYVFQVLYVVLVVGAVILNYGNIISGLKSLGVPVP